MSTSSDIFWAFDVRYFEAFLDPPFLILSLTSTTHECTSQARLEALCKLTNFWRVLLLSWRTVFLFVFWKKLKTPKKAFEITRPLRQEGIPSGMDLSNVNANYVSKQQSEKMNENIKGLNFNFLSCYLFSWKIKYGKIQKTRPEIPGCSTVYKLGQYYLS